MEHCIAKTEQILSGYLRESEMLINKNDNPYYNIPKPVMYIIKSFIKNYYANKGEYKWQINDHKMVQEMLNAKNGDKYESEIFKMARLKWKLEIYPNGNNENVIGYFVVHLRLLSLPSYIDEIQINRIFRVIENMTGSCWVESISDGQYEYWTKRCPLIELQKINPTTLTIDIFVEINKIFLKQNYDTYIETVIDSKKIKEIEMKYKLQYKMDILKYTEYCKSMCSEILYDIWCVEVYPRGYDDENAVDVCVYATLTNLNNIQSFSVKGTLTCLETGYVGDIHSTFTQQSNSWGKEGIMTWQSALKYDALTFVFDITILKIDKQQKPNMLEICDDVNITYLLTIN